MERILNSRLFSVFLLVLIFWLGNGLVRLNMQKNEVEKELAAYEGKAIETERNNDNIKKFLKYFENPAFLEREARLKYNYKKPDEEVAFVYEDINSQTASQSLDEIIKSMPNWKKWGYYIISIIND